MAETTEYRVAVIDPDTLRILSVRTSDGYCLPSAEAAPGSRVAEQLQRAMRSEWGVHLLILETLDAENGFPQCVVAELLSVLENSTLVAVDLNCIATRSLHDNHRSKMLSLIAGRDSSYFSRLGWIDEAVTWVETSTGMRVISKREIQQLNAGEGFALLRFRTSDGNIVWMKATAHPHEHELAVTSLLSRLSPDNLPQLLAVRPAWNAWLTLDGRGDEPGKSGPIQLEDAVLSMAELQTRTVGHDGELLDAGAFDHKIGTLRAKAPTLFDFAEEAMSQPIEGTARRVSGARIREVRAILSDIFDRLESIGLPDAVLHGDLHPGNIVTGPRRYRFIDWCEVYVGNPLIALQHPLLLNSSDHGKAKPWSETALQNRYCEIWFPWCDPAAMSEALVYMPLVAAMSTLYGRGDWLTGPQRDQPHVRKYVRNLTRYMDTAANSLLLLEALAA